MDRLKKVLGTSFLLGYLPWAPGTWASFGALIPIFFISTYFKTYGLVAFVILTSLITVWSADVCERDWGRDPSRVVMDEWAGQAVAFLFVPLTGSYVHIFMILLTGFVLFRLFDIIKPLGVYKLQKFPGGWGILLDDLLAGIYANIILETLILFILK